MELHPTMTFTVDLEWQKPGVKTGGKALTPVPPVVTDLQWQKLGVEL